MSWRMSISHVQKRCAQQHKALGARACCYGGTHDTLECRSIKHTHGYVCPSHAYLLMQQHKALRPAATARTAAHTCYSY